eukprot:8977456-Pyramimonas_sp.AAC.1
MTAQGGLTEGMMTDKEATSRRQGVIRTLVVRFDQPGDRRCCFEEGDAGSVVVNLGGCFPIRGPRRTFLGDR